MNRAQRLALKIILVIDALLILFPPFEDNRGHRYFDLGFHWLPYGFLTGSSPAFGRLASEIVIVSVVGFTAFVLMHSVSDDSLPRLTSPSLWFPEASSVLKWLGRVARTVVLCIGALIGVGTIGVGVVLATTAKDWVSLLVGIGGCIAGAAACGLIHLLREPS
jgi:hypothetical protein